jgi:integrase
MEDVQILLGHTSIRTTERNYAPWVKARQARLEKRITGA